jgi:hypothetical protein
VTNRKKKKRSRKNWNLNRTTQQRRSLLKDERDRETEHKKR